MSAPNAPSLPCLYPLPATAWAEGAQLNGRPFPATASAEGAQFNGAPFPATASAEGAQLNGRPSLWERGLQGRAFYWSDLLATSPPIVLSPCGRGILTVDGIPHQD
jgi:hypothetical protein